MMVKESSLRNTQAPMHSWALPTLSTSATEKAKHHGIHLVMSSRFGVRPLCLVFLKIHSGLKNISHTMWYIWQFCGIFF